MKCLSLSCELFARHAFVAALVLISVLVGATRPVAADPTPQPGFSVHDYSTVIEKGTEQRSRGSAPYVRPDTVEMERERAVQVPTSLGVVQLRWSRSVEELFGKNLQKAVLDAWTAASRAIVQNSFPSRLRSARYDWRVVIMDQVPSSADIGGGGLCHPAWMRPPADIFVAAGRVATRCTKDRLGQDDASRELAQSLIHELGHAVEFEFMGKGFGAAQRWHSEGFARWFEALGGEFLTGRDRMKSKPQLMAQARAVLDRNWRPADFRGTSEDYARAYALIAVIADSKSISRLSEVYGRMNEERIPLTLAVQRELGWDESAWVKEAVKFVAR